MSELDIFRVKQVLAIIENKLITDANTCELTFLINLKEELINKLKEQDAGI